MNTRKDIEQEVERLYHLCMTDKGRIDIIIDYIMRVMNEQQSELEDLRYELGMYKLDGPC